MRYRAQVSIAAAEADDRFWHFVTRRPMTEMGSEASDPYCDRDRVARPQIEQLVLHDVARLAAVHNPEQSYY